MIPKFYKCIRCGKIADENTVKKSRRYTGEGFTTEFCGCEFFGNEFRYRNVDLHELPFMTKLRILFIKPLKNKKA